MGDSTAKDRSSVSKNLGKALEIAARKDHLDILQLMETHQRSVETLTQNVENIDRKLFLNYIKSVEEAEKRVRSEPGKKNGNHAVYYKLAGEYYAWSGKYEKSKKVLE